MTRLRRQTHFGFNNKRILNSRGAKLFSLKVFALSMFATSVVAEPPLTEMETPVGAPFERPVGFNRDGNFNRTLRRGPSIGASSIAIANMVSVNQGGSGNTIVLSVRQQNSGSISVTSDNNLTTAAGQPSVQDVSGTSTSQAAILNGGLSFE